MFDKLSYTWELMASSWSVLKKTKGLLVFPLLSGICCMAVMASFIVPLVYSGRWQPPDPENGRAAQIAYWGLMFLLYFCLYFVISFFNVAIISGAISRMAGGEPTVSGCFREAVKRIHLIFGWALVMATVGLILRMLEERFKRVGRFIAGLIGMAWSMISFLVVPILVVEEKSPIEALKESTALLKRNWGEQLIGNFSFGLIFFLLFIPSIIVLIITFIVAPPMVALIVLVVVLVYWVLLSLIQSALQSIFQAAVYMHTQSVYCEEFPPSTLASAMSPKD